MQQSWNVEVELRALMQGLAALAGFADSCPTTEPNPNSNVQVRLRVIAVCAEINFMLATAHGSIRIVQRMWNVIEPGTGQDARGQVKSLMQGLVSLLEVFQVSKAHA